MIRALLISTILFFNYLYLCDALKVKLKHNSFKGNVSTIEMNCYGKYDKKEALANLIITKDGKEFYSYDNRTRKVTLTPVPGIPNNSIIQFQTPGHFAMTRLNKTTSGYYNCTIFSNKNRKSDRDYIQVKDSNTALKSKGSNTVPKVKYHGNHGNHGNHASSSNNLRVRLSYNRYLKNRTTFEINCYGLYPKNETLANITISKDGKQFYRYDSATKAVVLTEVPGIPRNSISLLLSPGRFVMSRINRTTNGYYNCTIFSNRTRNYARTYIHVSGSSVPSSHLILPIVMVIISIFK